MLHLSLSHALSAGGSISGMDAKRLQLAALGGFLLLSSLVGFALPRLLPPAQRKPPPSRSTRPLPERTFAQLHVEAPTVGALYSVDNADGHPDTLSLDPDRGYEGPGFDSVSVTHWAFLAWKPQ